MKQVVDTRRNSIILFLVLALYFILNDFIFIAVQFSSFLFYLIDNMQKIIVTLVIYRLWKAEKISSDELGWKKPAVKPFIFWAVLIAVTGVVLDQFGWRFFQLILPDIVISNYPNNTSAFFYLLSWVIGIPLTALNEETIFRGLARNVFGKKIPTVLVVILSCLIFGAARWGVGLYAIPASMLLGVLPMIAVLRTGSIWPAVLGRVVVDIVNFSGAVPTAWFDWMLR